MKSPALKAGLVGVLVILFVNLVGLVPVIGCVSLPLELFAYVAIGALAAFWMTPRRETGARGRPGRPGGLDCRCRKRPASRRS